MLNAEQAAGLIKMCLVSRTAFGFSLAARKLEQLKQTNQADVQSLLANSLDDMFVLGRVADWVAYNLAAVFRRFTLRR